jgi:hypothetical protein
MYSYETFSRSVRVEIQTFPHKEPLREGVVRIIEAYGFWHFKPLENGLTEITYQLHANPNGSIPAWLANKTVVNTPFDAIKGLCTMAKKGK